MVSSGAQNGRACAPAKILKPRPFPVKIYVYTRALHDQSRCRSAKDQYASRGGTTCFRYVTRKRIITNIPIAHVIHRLYAGFLTDRHWTVVRNLKLRRGLLIVQLKASSILVQFIETRSRLMCYIRYGNTKL